MISPKKWVLTLFQFEGCPCRIIEQSLYHVVIPEHSVLKTLLEVSGITYIAFENLEEDILAGLDPIRFLFPGSFFLGRLLGYFGGLNTVSTATVPEIDVPAAEYEAIAFKRLDVMEGTEFSRVSMLPRELCLQFYFELTIIARAERSHFFEIAIHPESCAECAVVEHKQDKPSSRTPGRLKRSALRQSYESALEVALNRARTLTRMYDEEQTTKYQNALSEIEKQIQSDLKALEVRDLDEQELYLRKKRILSEKRTYSENLRKQFFAEAGRLRLIALTQTFRTWLRYGIEITAKTWPNSNLTAFLVLDPHGSRFVAFECVDCKKRRSLTDTELGSAASFWCDHHIMPGLRALRERLTAALFCPLTRLQTILSFRLIRLKAVQRTLRAMQLPITNLIYLLRKRIFEYYIEHYPVGCVVQGTIATTADRTSAVELPYGVAGTLNIEHSHINPRETFHAQILDFDPLRLKIDLSAIDKSIWLKFVHESTTGDLLNGKIINITEKSIVIDTFYGFLCVADSRESSAQYVRSTETPKIGDWVSARVAQANEDDKRISVSISDTPQPTLEAIDQFEADWSFLRRKRIGKDGAEVTAGTSRKLLTLSEIAQRTQISMPALLELRDLYQDRIPSTGTGHQQHYLEEALDVFLQLRKENASQREVPGKLYTLTEVAKKTKISMPTLQRYKKLYQDRIPSTGTGRRQRYPEEALDVFLQLRKENASQREVPGKLYTLTEVAKKTKISMPTLQRYKKLYQDRIPSTGTGRQQRYPEEALDVFLQLRKENASQREVPGKLYTLTEVAKKTKISMPTLQRYKKLYQDRIPSTGTGRQQRYPEEALDVFSQLKRENIARRSRPKTRSS